MKAPLLALLFAWFVTVPLAMAQSAKELAAEAKIKKALDRAVIPKLEFHEATVQEALDFLSDKIRGLEIDGHGIPVSVVIAPPTELAGTSGLTDLAKGKISITPTNIPIYEALRYVTGYLALKFYLRADGVHIVAFWDIEPSDTRILQIPPDFFPAHEKQDRIDHTDLVTEMKKDFRGFLATYGAHLPKEATVNLNKAGTRLTVHTNVNDFPNIENVLRFYRPPSAWPAPGPEVPKIIDGDSFERDAERRKVEANVAKKIHTIILPKVALESISITEAAQILHEMSLQSDAHSPEAERGVEISPASSPDSPDENEPAAISYSAANVPLSEALEAIARLSHRHVRIEEDTVRLEIKTPDQRYVSRTYLIPPQLPTNLSLAGAPSLGQAHGAGPMTSGSTAFEPAFVNFKTWRARSVVILDTVAKQRPLLEQMEQGWREYYATKKTKKMKAR